MARHTGRQVSLWSVGSQPVLNHMVRIVTVPAEAGAELGGAQPPQPSPSLGGDEPATFNPSEYNSAPAPTVYQGRAPVNEVHGSRDSAWRSTDEDTRRHVRESQEKQAAELRVQIEEKRLRKEAEARALQLREAREDAEIAAYNPFGRGGAGAPLYGTDGQLHTDLRHKREVAGGAAASTGNAHPAPALPPSLAAQPNPAMVYGGPLSAPPPGGDSLRAPPEPAAEPASPARPGGLHAHAGSLNVLTGGPAHVPWGGGTAAHEVPHVSPLAALAPERWGAAAAGGELGGAEPAQDESIAGLLARAPAAQPMRAPPRVVGGGGLSAAAFGASLLSAEDPAPASRALGRGAEAEEGGGGGGGGRRGGASSARGPRAPLHAPRHAPSSARSRAEDSRLNSELDGSPAKRIGAGPSGPTLKVDPWAREEKRSLNGYDLEKVEKMAPRGTAARRPGRRVGSAPADALEPHAPFGGRGAAGPPRPMAGMIGRGGPAAGPPPAAGRRRPPGPASAGPVHGRRGGGAAGRARGRPSLQSEIDSRDEEIAMLKRELQAERRLVATRTEALLDPSARSPDALAALVGSQFPAEGGATRAGGGFGYQVDSYGAPTYAPAEPSSPSALPHSQLGRAPDLSPSRALLQPAAVGDDVGAVGGGGDGGGGRDPYLSAAKACVRADGSRCGRLEAGKMLAMIARHRLRVPHEMAEVARQKGLCSYTIFIDRLRELKVGVYPA